MFCRGQPEGCIHPVVAPAGRWQARMARHTWGGADRLLEAGVPIEGIKRHQQPAR